MARVWSEGSHRIGVRISIADPLQMVSLMCGFMLVLSLLGLVGFAASFASVTVHIPNTQRIFGLVMFVSMAALFGFVTAFGMGQVWRFDKRSGRIDVLRAGLIVRSETMVGLDHLELQEIDDDDGGAARALLVYTDNRSVALNRINTGSTRELAILVAAVNQFLTSGE